MLYNFIIVVALVTLIFESVAAAAPLLAAVTSKSSAAAIYNKIDELYSKRSVIRVSYNSISIPQGILSSLNYKPVVIEGASDYSNDDISIYSNEDENKSIIIMKSDSTVISPEAVDVSLLYLSKSLFMNDNQLFMTISHALQSLQGKEDDKKPTLVVVIPSTAAVSEQEKEMYVANCKSMIQAVWFMIDKKPYHSNDINSEISVMYVDNNSSTEISSILTSSLEAPLTFKKSTQTIKGSSTSSSNMKTMATGIEDSKQGVQASLELARDICQKSISMLKDGKNASLFATFISNLQQETMSNYIKYIEKYKTKDMIDVYNSLYSVGYTDITSEIFRMLQPFYRHQLQLCRQELINNYNIYATEDIEITTSIIDDLIAAKDKMLKDFSEKIKILTPVNAPSSWISSYDVVQLDGIITDYIGSRRDTARLQGILPRSRRPIDISIHYFVNHPVGRDYRQDIIGGNTNRDVPFYDSALSAEGSSSITPSVARKVLSKEVSDYYSRDKDDRIYSNINKLKKDNEFAREMLMFPLSIKNPDVPMNSQRKQKRSVPPVLQSGNESPGVTSGPEQYIDWDNISIMNRIRSDTKVYISNMVKEKKVLVSSNKDVISRIQSVLNQIPLISKPYKHPVINYGVKYTASSNR